jgi:NADH:ubiquinone oxidoreductase subunit 6 (subunit J)
MLLNAPREEVVQANMIESAGMRAVGGLLAIAFAAELAWALTRSRTLATTPAGDRPSFSVSEIGQRLFQEYAFAFEATSILILVAMVGAVTLAGRHLSEKRRPGPPISASAKATADLAGALPHEGGPNPKSLEDQNG